MIDVVETKIPKTIINVAWRKVITDHLGGAHILKYMMKKDQIEIATGIGMIMIGRTRMQTMRTITVVDVQLQQAKPVIVQEQEDV